MDRRKFLLSAGAMTCVGLGRAAAEMRCNMPDYYGRQTCEVGIPSIRFYAARQECQQWCWAACIQMVFATAGRYVDQREIVARLFGDLRCAPAPNGYAIISAITGRWEDQNGRRFGAQASPLLDLRAGIQNPQAAAAAANELAAAVYPLINGALGHATVMTAMTYVRDAYGNGQPLSFVVRDPWPSSPSRRQLNFNEVYGTEFLAAIRVG